MIKYSDEINNSIDVKNAELLIYTISKREIVDKDYKRILRSLETLKKVGKDAKRKLFLIIEGYNDDKREVYMIPEIREFIQYVYSKYKYLFYFLTCFDNNRSLILACLTKYEATKCGENKYLLEIICEDEIKNEITNEMLEYGKQIGETEVEMIKEISTFILM